MGRTQSEIAIWNKALSRIGETDFVEATTQSTPAAEACSLHYEDCLEQMLERFPWPFATKQADISSPSGVSRTGWDYIYTLPSDCIRPIALLAEDVRVSLLGLGGAPTFEIRLNDAGNGRLLCCDLDVSVEDFEVLEYIPMLTSAAITTMPRAFIDALAWRLAAELAMALKKDPTLAAKCLGAYEGSIDRAMCDVLNAREEDPRPTTPSIAKRG